MANDASIVVIGDVRVSWDRTLMLGFYQSSNRAAEEKKYTIFALSALCGQWTMANVGNFD